MENLKFKNKVQIFNDLAAQCEQMVQKFSDYFKTRKNKFFYMNLNIKILE